MRPVSACERSANHRGDDGAPNEYDRRMAKVMIKPKAKTPAVKHAATSGTDNSPVSAPASRKARAGEERKRAPEPDEADDAHGGASHRRKPNGASHGDEPARPRARPAREGADGRARRRANGIGPGPTVDDFATGSDAPLVEPPRSLEKALGAQVRQLRRERDLSLADLAAGAGLSVGMMSKIENGQISPSLSTINALANALHVPFTSLFTAFEEKRDCSYVPAGMGSRIERRGTKVGHVYQLLGKVLGGEVSVEPYLITLEKNAVPYAGFRHAGVELIHMLTGEVVYRHGDECYRLKPGDTLLFDSGALHGPERLIEVPMTYLSIIVYPRA